MELKAMRKEVAQFKENSDLVEYLYQQYNKQDFEKMLIPFFQATDNLGTYLGFPLTTGKLNKTAFNFLIEKLREKNFHAGKNKFLTLAGRTTLIKSTLCSIPIHIMQIFKLPESILQQLDKLSRNFLWGSSDHKREIHLV